MPFLSKRSRSALAAAALAGLAMGGSIAAAQEAGSGSARYDARSTSGAYLAGRMALEKKDMASAARFLARALAADPANRALQRSAFQAHVAAGNMAEAIKLAEGLAAGADRANLAQVVLAAAALKRGDLAAAKRHAEALQSEGPNRLLRPGILAWIELGQGSAERAIDALRPLVGVDGLAAFQQYHQALINDVAGRVPQAEAAYRVTAERSPPFRIVQAYAAFLFRNGKADEARAIVARYLQQDPGSSAADFLLARIAGGKAPARFVNNAAEGIAELFVNLAGALQQESAGEAAMIYSRLADYLRPNDPDTLHAIGGILENDEIYDTAIEYYRRVPVDAEASWHARRAAAGVLGQLKRIDEAVAVLEGMARERADRWDALLLLGNLLRNEKQFEKAVDAYDRAVGRAGKLEERHWNLLYVRGIALERAKNWPRAEADFKKALELKPNEPYVLNYLAYTWVDRGENLAEATAMLETAVKLKPDDGAITDSVGWAYYRLGQFEKALQFLERASELTPEDPTINDHLGDVYWRVGRRAEARFQWHRALSLNPEPEDVPKIKEKIEQGMKPFESGKAP
jgi:tetratricopeptide (TPR) repeat protein